MQGPKFTFGRNWQSFNQTHLDAQVLAMAKVSLEKFTGLKSFEGKTFIDIGAGSGLYSLAALQMGAKEVVSVDVDPDCVKCCQDLKEKEGGPAHWKIIHGSALNTPFMESLGTFDVVYSWGVLHHTGDMWKAIDNTMKLVKPHGIFFLAIYNKVEDVYGIYPDGRFGTSGFWLLEKKIYSALPAFFQRVVDYACVSVLFVAYLLTFRNPFRVMREQKNYFNKGMSWVVSIRDWLGGYPYEVATVAEIFHFAKERGFSLENLTCNNGLLNNEFLLKKHG